MSDGTQTEERVGRLAGAAGKAPPPDPRGWYALAFSKELARGAVLVRRLAEREVVLFRSESGEVGALDPVCPHLGAHLGHGGRVEGESLRCPFHAFRFATDGRCVATGYGTKPPKASATAYAVAEKHGLVLVHFDPLGRAPAFVIPELDERGYTELRTACFELRGHPQETTENSVDIGHLGVVHGYQDVRIVEDLHTDGAYLGATYAMRRPEGLFGRLLAGRAGGGRLGALLGGIEARFRAHVHGLGYSHVEVDIPALGLVTRNFVLATPVGGGKIELRLALAMKRLTEHPALPAGLRGLPLGAFDRMLLDRAFSAYLNDVQQDFLVWQHKQWVDRPALAQGDGPIARYRKWAAQFYDAS